MHYPLIVDLCVLLLLLYYRFRVRSYDMRKYLRVACICGLIDILVVTRPDVYHVQITVLQ